MTGAIHRDPKKTACYAVQMYIFPGATLIALVVLFGWPARAADDCEISVTGISALVEATPDHDRFQGCAPEKADLVCRWAWPIGAPESRRMFQNLATQLQTCGDGTTVTRDKAVNHPDFFDAWMFQGNEKLATLSLKDKSAMGATYVVLRIPSAP